MTYYILEWSYETTTDVEIFDSLKEVQETLKLELESAWENDGIFEVMYLGTYERGVLTPLAVELDREVPELDDWIDKHYSIRDVNWNRVGTFIVRIDGRNR